MINAEQYINSLLSTPNNHTCTNLAEHMEDVSHDVLSDFLCTGADDGAGPLVHGAARDR